MPPQATARSPFAGCLILILALLILLFLIGFSAWIPFRQADEIEKFTAPSPAPLPIEAIEGNEPRVNQLVERLEAFRQQLHGDTSVPARLELDASDLNLAIAAFDPVRDLRGSFRIREITGDHLVIDICYKLNGRPRLARDDEENTITSDPRYLIGTLKGRPQLTRRELVLKVDSLEVPSATVAEGFMNHFETLRIFEDSLKHPTLGPAMAAMTRAEISNGKLILSRLPGESPPDLVSDDDMRKGGSRLITWLGIGACIFLAFAALMVVLGIRKQRRDAKTNDTRDDA